MDCKQFWENMYHNRIDMYGQFYDIQISNPRPFEGIFKKCGYYNPDGSIKEVYRNVLLNSKDNHWILDETNLTVYNVPEEIYPEENIPKIRRAKPFPFEYKSKDDINRYAYNYNY